ncbi:hypothetical protein C0J52_14702 [Blattella germanica]|nr:hypothetical protein C0J52_14702 [Blattella germanica]
MQSWRRRCEKCVRLQEITSRSDTSFTFFVRLVCDKKNRSCYNLNALVLILCPR